MAFVGWHYADGVAKERELKRDGLVDVATTGLTQAPIGTDYRLGGRITSFNQRDGSTGMIQRRNQSVFGTDRLVAPDMCGSCTAYSKTKSFRPSRASADPLRHVPGLDPLRLPMSRWINRERSRPS
jgi:hypothetical protein